MSVLIVNFELRNKSKDYAPFHNAVKHNCNEWWHFLEATYIVSTNLNADQFAKTLFPFMEKADALFVSKLAKEYQGWLPQEAWNWLNAKWF